MSSLEHVKFIHKSLGFLEHVQLSTNDILIYLYSSVFRQLQFSALPLLKAFTNLKVNIYAKPYGLISTSVQVTKGRKRQAQPIAGTGNYSSERVASSVGTIRNKNRAPGCIRALCCKPEATCAAIKYKENAFGGMFFFPPLVSKRFLDCFSIALPWLQEWSVFTLGTVYFQVMVERDGPEPFVTKWTGKVWRHVNAASV